MKAKELRAMDEAALNKELNELLNTHFKLRRRLRNSSRTRISCARRVVKSPAFARFSLRRRLRNDRKQR